MSAKAYASMDSARTFYDKNQNVLSYISSFRESALSVFAQLGEDCGQKYNSYKQLFSRAQQTEAVASRKLALANSELAAARVRLSSTPQSVKRETTDSQGNKSVKEEHNPAYDGALAAVNRAFARVGNAKNALSRAKEACKQIQDGVNSLSALIGRVAELKNSLVSRVNGAYSMAEGASNSVLHTISALESYLSYGI